MEKHITLVGVLNIAYRAFILLWAFIFFALAAGFSRVFQYLMRTEAVHMHDVPFEILDIVPFILTLVGTLMFVVSVIGIIGGVAVLKRKEWGRIVLLVVSFFNLAHVPLGTALGVYTIWALLNDDTIRAFRPPDIATPAATK
jgi:hypothetical protein